MPGIKIDQSITIRRNDDLISNEIDGEIVMMSIEKGNYYGMNNIGSRIWSLIEQPVRVSDIISSLTLEYDVSYETCAKEVLSFLRSLQNENIIEASK